MLEVLRGAGKAGIWSWGDNRSGRLLHMYIQGFTMHVYYNVTSMVVQRFNFSDGRPMRLNERHSIVSAGSLGSFLLG
jgi:hypothetical protein